MHEPAHDVDDYDRNIYYHPETYGLEIVAEYDSADSYEYDTTVIFRDKEDGRLYYVSDSGCSCPTPFEDVRLSDLIPLSPNSVPSFKDHVLDQHQFGNPRDVVNFIDKALVLCCGVPL